MNDSDLDFVDLCSKLLKRVRKKPDDPRQPKKDENHSSSQASEGDKSRRKHRKEEREKLSATQPAGNRGEQPKLSGPESGDAGSSSAVSGGQRAKEIVLERMQQFKRSSPQKMHKDPIQAPGNDEDTPPEDSDEVLALRLQQELDKESAQAQIVDLEDGGLFFCQICHKDLSHMTPEGRTQHINRCLDESEDSAPAPAAAAAPSSGIPDCPICGKKFKSQKSRCAHLKRCSSDMGVSPAVLLQALQRQAEEPCVFVSVFSTQTSGTKRKGPPKSGLPARKRPRTKQEPLDEETMVALALSSSLQEQERQGAAAAERLLQTESGASHSCRTAALTAGMRKTSFMYNSSSNRRLSPPQQPQFLILPRQENKPPFSPPSCTSLLFVVQEPLSRLESDLSSMVNNPQLSDVQLQVDSGEVFFAHSFMVYARCPLLAEMVHESGFGVQEEGLPAAQRVLLSDVPDEAVLVLLQYLYTGRGAVPAPLQPHVLELAARLAESLNVHSALQDLLICATRTDQEENVNNQTDQAFMELLRSMWVEGEEEEDGSDSDDREMEEQVNEKELEEIYEFAATQRKKEVEDSEEEEEVEERLHDEEDDGASAFTKLQPDSQLHPSLDRSFDRLFSESWGVYEEGDSGTPKTRPSEPEQQQQPPSKPPAELSCGALLQSSADNLSLSPSPRSSSLPVPGPSPLQLTAGQRDDAAERDSRGPGSVCAPPSPAPEPELIVLSDSSEDMEVDAPGPSPPSPRVPHTPQSYTEIRPIQTPPPPEPAVKNKESSGEKWSPGAPLDCSPEVSWLIPSTPPRPGRSPPTPTTTSSSTQTRSSMSRTQLFPKVEASPPPSCRFSSLLRLSCSPGVSEDADTAAPSQTKPSHPSPSLSIPAPPHSSTPLHTEHLLPAPPRHIHPSQCESRGGRSESLGSFQLTQNRRSKSSQQRAAESRRGDESAAVMDTERATAWADEDAGDAEGETREAEEAESSFRPSFGAMDDPPIAFDDSWGLDACADAGPGRFSLRLEDSGPSSHQTPERSSSSASHPAPSSPAVQDSLTDAEPKPGPSVTSPPDPNARTTAELDEDLLDSRMWDSWGEEVEEEEEVVPLSQSPSWSQPVFSPGVFQLSPLDRFGVRPLPKRQMILKLKEIHQYTHQLLSSDSEDEARGKPPPGRPAEFREPPAPPPATQRGQDGEEEEEDGEEEPLSASQGSNTSSTLCVSSSGDSDGDVSSSQAASRLQDRLLAVRALILSDAELYSRILHYEPLVLSQLQRQLKAAGIRLGATKLVDYLDSQCITFTTAKPGHRRGHGGVLERSTARRSSVC
uniref:Structure-specific endonuclease subunit SLX4 n=1 Tax=Salarias fasciatus TaxID=181472 RepID=A0A672HJV9_SALFA